MEVLRDADVNRDHHDLTALSDEKIDLIQQYTDEWFDLAVKQGLVKWPYVIDDAMIASIQACYRKNMSPIDAMYFCRRVRDEIALFDVQPNSGRAEIDAELVKPYL